MARCTAVLDTVGRWGQPWTGRADYERLPGSAEQTNIQPNKPNKVRDPEGGAAYIGKDIGQ